MAKTAFVSEGTNGTRFTRDSRGVDLLDTINGQAQRSARTWQVVALVSLSAFFVGLGVLVYTLSLRRLIPVIVTVNPEGRADYVGELDKSNYTASVPEIAREYIVRQLIGRMNTWIVDPDAQQRYINETQAIVQKGAVGQLDKFYRANNPFDYLGQFTQSVSVEPIHKQADKTYFTYFSIRRRTVSGDEVSVHRYGILVNLDTFSPTPQNPLGIFVTNFDIKLDK